MSSSGSPKKPEEDPSDTSTPATAASMTSVFGARPTHIPMPPSPYANMNISFTPSPTGRLDNPFDSPFYSPALVFYTAPSTPIAESPAPQEPLPAPITPPLTSVMHIPVPVIPTSQSQFSLHIQQSPSSTSGPVIPAPELVTHHPQSPPTSTDDAFPETYEPPDDTTLDDEGLSTLERIYLYTRSKSSFHRVFIANALPELLEQVTPHEAIEYVLPLLNTLATDDDEMVKEAFSSKLVTIIWWFFTHCQLIPEDAVDEDSMNPPEFQDQQSPPTIPVQAFTPILGTLLLNPNALVGGATRYAVVALLGRIKRVNAMESIHGSDTPNVPVKQLNTNPIAAHPAEGDNGDLVIGLFGSDERALFEKELIFQVVVGMGFLGEEEAEPALEERQVHRMSVDYQEPQVDIVVDEESPPIQQPKQGFQIPSPMREVVESPAPRSDAKQNNPYFPPLTSYSFAVPIQSTSEGSPLSSSSSGSSSSTPSSTTSTTSGSEEEISPLASLTVRSSSDSTVTSLGGGGANSDHQPTPPARPPSPPPINSHQPDVHAFSAEGKWPPSPSYSHQQDASNYGTLALASAPGIPSPPSSSFSDVKSYDSVDLDEEGECDQAAIGRLSSMSLMAAVAASGYLDDTSTDAFVAEVERVSRDPVYWVRREACFALGALAKVVPAEIVQLTLMRTLQNLVTDPVHNVRHSSLFALPTILGRLPPAQRRQVALDVMIPMSMDEYADVRAGVLEALGEVIYTFHEDTKASLDFADLKIEESQTPPEELLEMFLGRTQDRRLIDDQQRRYTTQEEEEDEEEEQVQPKPLITDKHSALEAFYADPSRPLICAFNFPAVTLTVGRNRWSSRLRDTYLWLTSNDTPAVKRTLAASLGEMAKILGEEYAQRDLLDVWRNAFHASDEEVRLKLVDCLVTFVGALPRNGRIEVFNALSDTWKSGGFTGWREREGIAKSLNDLLNVGGSEVMGVVAKLLMHSLADSVNTVREAAISILPHLWMTFKGKGFLDSVRSDILSMARSELSRRRMTYIACQYALVISTSPEVDPSMEIDDELCDTLGSLASDSIVGVRIGVARLIAFICGDLLNKDKPVPRSLLDVIPLLSQDSSHEVRSYVVDCLVNPRETFNSSEAQRYPGIAKSGFASVSASAATFSRPPARNLAPISFVSRAG